MMVGGGGGGGRGAKADTCASDRRALQQLALNVHVKPSDLPRGGGGGWEKTKTKHEFALFFNGSSCLGIFSHTFVVNTCWVAIKTRPTCQSSRLFWGPLKISCRYRRSKFCFGELFSVFVFVNIVWCDIVCVCARARARVCVCVCQTRRNRGRVGSSLPQ